MTFSKLSMSVFMAAALHAGGAAAADDNMTPAQCLGDLEDAAAFMTANDAGAPTALADHGPLIAQALDRARGAIGQVTDVKSCGKTVYAYLRSWRGNHIGLALPERAPAGGPGANPAGGAAPSTPAAAHPGAPRFRVLGKDTLLLSLPDFDDEHAQAIKTLLAAHRADLLSRRNWIVDVRGNGGGSDSTYAPLLGWLLDGDVRGYSVEYLATPANIAAQEALCARASDAAGCRKELDPILAKMRTAAPGSFVLADDGRIASVPVKLEAKRPARVAVLADHGCGSSCEQFVLEARTSYRVKILGRPTAGALDVSNLRRHPLPSGRIVLRYATTRSTRLPDMRIDDIGIAPDILLPKPADAAAHDAEVLQVQRWIEGGSLDAR